MACCDDKIKVSSCCFCISLQTGAKIIGFFMLLGGILSLLADILETFTFYDDPSVSAYNEATTKRPIALIILLFDLVTIAIAIVLLVGAFRMKPRLLKAFCITALVLVLLGLISRILDNIVDGYHPEYDLGIYMNFLLDLYWILVVKSAYHEMKEELEGQRGQGGQVYSYNDNTQMHQLKPLNP